MELQLQSVTKTYGTTGKGIRDCSFSMGNGVLGLLGTNGAGKSTLMNLLATITQPQSGSIYLDGTDIVRNPNSLRKALGYLPQDWGIYPNLTAAEFLRYFAALKGLGGPTVRKRITSLLELVNLNPHSKQYLGTFSGGMRQRVGIAQALLNDPKLLILDEPTVGLDPEERIGFRNLLSELGRHTVVILSSHIISDIDTIAKEIAILKDGRLLTKATPAHLIAAVANKVYHVSIPEETLAGFGMHHMIISSTRKNERIDVRYIAEKQTAEGSDLCQPTLEDAYLYIQKRHAV